MLIGKKAAISVGIAILVVIMAFPIIADRVDEIHKGHLKFMNNLVENNLQKQQQMLAKFNRFANRISRMSKGFHIKIPVNEKYARKIRPNRHTGRTKYERKKFAYVSEPYRLRSKPNDSNRRYVITVRRNTRVEVQFSVSAKKRRSNITTRWMSVKYRNKEGFIPLNLLSRTWTRAFHHVPKMKPIFDGNIDSIYSEVLSHRLSEQKGHFVESNFYRFDPSVVVKAYGRKKRITAKPYLTMRAGDSTKSSVIGRVYYGEVVKVIRYGKRQYIDGKNARWAKVNYSGSEGWVYGGYLENVHTGRTKKITKFEKGENYYIKAKLCRVREQPNKNSIVILSIPHQEEVYSKSVKSTPTRVGNITSQWVKIKYENYTGWVFGGFLSGGKTKVIDSNADKYQNMTHKQYVWPVKGYRRISSRYGWRTIYGRRNFHSGIDIVAPRGAPIRATKTGQCIMSRWGRGYGNYVVLDHGKGKRSLYGHMHKRFAVKGKVYKGGRTIGLVGSTGYSTGPHLHFEIRVHNKALNPARYVHP